MKKYPFVMALLVSTQTFYAQAAIPETFFQPSNGLAFDLIDNRPHSNSLLNVMGGGTMLELSICILLILFSIGVYLFVNYLLRIQRERYNLMNTILFNELKSTQVGLLHHRYLIHSIKEQYESLSGKPLEVEWSVPGKATFDIQRIADFEYERDLKLYYQEMDTDFDVYVRKVQEGLILYSSADRIDNDGGNPAPTQTSSYQTSVS